MSRLSASAQAIVLDPASDVFEDAPPAPAGERRRS
jgi:hypothetical protein